MLEMGYHMCVSGIILKAMKFKYQLKICLFLKIMGLKVDEKLNANYVIEIILLGWV